jgi:hypothetical protein
MHTCQATDEIQGEDLQPAVAVLRHVQRNQAATAMVLAQALPLTPAVGGRICPMSHTSSEAIIPLVKLSSKEIVVGPV